MTDTAGPDDGERLATSTAGSAASGSGQEAGDLLAGDDPVTVILIGDSTSDKPHRGGCTGRPVTWRSSAPSPSATWDQDLGTDYYPQVALADDDGAGGAVTVWNGSVPDSTTGSATYPW